MAGRGMACIQLECIYQKQQEQKPHSAQKQFLPIQRKAKACRHRWYSLGRRQDSRATVMGEEKGMEEKEDEEESKKKS